MTIIPLTVTEIGRLLVENFRDKDFHPLLSETVQFTRAVEAMLKEKYITQFFKDVKP